MNRIAQTYTVWFGSNKYELTGDQFDKLEALRLKVYEKSDGDDAETYRSCRDWCKSNGKLVATRMDRKPAPQTAASLAANVDLDEIVEAKVSTLLEKAMKEQREYLDKVLSKNTK